MDKQKQLELASDLRNKLVELCTQFNPQMILSVLYRLWGF